MAIDAAHRSSIYTKLLPILGESDANILMSEFPSVEAEELVTKDFLRAELGTTRADSRSEMAGLSSGLRAEMAMLRSDMGTLETRLTIRIGAAFAASTIILGTLNLVG